MLCAGGDLTPQRLVMAYINGIFPWYSPGEPILWWSPDPRMTLIPGQIKITRSLRKTLRNGNYRVRLDTRFKAVIQSCARTPRKDQPGTWITPEIQAAYCKLHELGYADYDGKFFTLTARVLRLGTGALAGMPLAQMVQPWLDQLSEQIGQSCSVAILDDTDIVYVARAAQRRVMSIGLMPGSRLPAHCTSLGRVLLAALPTDQVNAMLDRSNLAPRTRYSRTLPDDIMADGRDDTPPQERETL